MATFSITFLGTGTSLGVPVICCECGVCASSDPRDRRTRSSIYVETPEMSWLVDCGPDFRTQALREQIRRIDAVLFTHSHTDHIMGFDDLRPFCRNGRELPVYGSRETIEDLARVFEFAFSGKFNYPGYILPRPHIIEAAFQFESTRILPLPVRHGRGMTFGYLFSREDRPLVAYLSDCNEVPGDVVDKIRGVDTLIIDALRHAPHPTHLNVPEALEISRRIAPRQTLFTHLSHELPHATTEAELPPDVCIAYDGLKLHLA